MQNNWNKTFGVKGEEIASQYLIKNNYKIVERNFRIRNGEIDIIGVDFSEKEKTLVFVEVKTRTSNQFGTPAEAITSWKLHFLIRAAQFYKISHQNLPDIMRIDAVFVELTRNGDVQNIELIKNISGF